MVWVLGKGKGMGMGGFLEGLRVFLLGLGNGEIRTWTCVA